MESTAFTAFSSSLPAADGEIPSTERLVTWTFLEEIVNRTDHPQSHIVPFPEERLATVAVPEAHRSAPASCIRRLRHCSSTTIGDAPVSGGTRQPPLCHSLVSSPTTRKVQYR